MPAHHGPTKFFFADENLDRLFAMNMALGAEISALSEKLDTVIALLQRQGTFEAGAVKAFEASDAEQAALDAERSRLVKSILAPFELAAEALIAEAKAAKG